MRTYLIEYAESAGALERFLNKCRRKNLEIEAMLLGECRGGVRRLVVRFSDACPSDARLIPNLARVLDVLSVEPAPADAIPALP